eukprot:g2910.t1
MEEDLFSCFDASEEQPKKRECEDENTTTEPVKKRVKLSNSTSAKSAVSHALTQRQITQKSTVISSSSAPLNSSVVSAKEEERKLGSYESQAAARAEAANGVVKGGAGTSSKNCIHEVELPANYPQTVEEVLANTQAPPTPLIHNYGFELDPFQKHSVACIEKGQSVLVAAHTSAGKTAVAEYAIKRALLDGATVIYTSPIKALSNQKYRDLAETFPNQVGLMTGDVTINPNAPCLVMTTEILRSMLYRGSEVMREVAWVIYDEVHYMRDKERGVVWEESMIMLPHKVRFVFLSATIPNATQFAAWIAKVHDQPCHVVYTEYRPTPLVHYMFPSNGEGQGLHLVVDEKGKFREKNFQKAVSKLSMSNLELQVAEGTGRGKKSKKQSKKTIGSELFRIVELAMNRKYGPVIIFSFAKRECEAYALQLAKMDLTDDEEKGMIKTIFMNAMESLSEDDRDLPQIQSLLPLLKRGIGIHHGGLLPIAKECIEILFGEGLLKCLFATETFAMGINMPAKTVIFTAARKFDGTDFRYISAGEYIQMSGRAGRRGLDDRGIVIQMISDKMEPDAARRILKGVADPLNSSFYLSYNMILNLLRLQEASCEDMIRQSFLQFQTEEEGEKLEGKIKNLISERDAIVVRDEPTVSAYFKLSEQMSREGLLMNRTMFQPQYILPFMQPGRLVKVRDDKGQDWGWGAIVSFTRTQEKDEVSYVCEALLHASSNSGGDLGKAVPYVENSKDAGQMIVLPLLLTQLEAVSSIRIFVSKDLRQSSKRENVRQSICEVKRRFPDGLPLLDPIEDLGIEDKAFLDTIKRVEILQEQLITSPFANESDKEERFELFKRKILINDEVKECRAAIRKAKKLIHKDTLKSMKRVLRRLGHTDKDNVVQLKGRVACCLNSPDALLLCELLFNGVFNELDVPTTVALMSIFSGTVDKTKGGEVDLNLIRKELRTPFRVLTEGARHVAKVSLESGLTIDVEEYVSQFSPAIMEVAFLWSKGSPFKDICKVTELFEGSIIRSIRRLEEVLREMSAATKAMGSEKLSQKFLDGIKSIKRDIVFAASLYL